MSSRALVVDDEPDILQTLGLALKAEGIVIETAANGREALAIFTGRGPFDLVLTDLKMPEMDGLELLRHIRILDDTVEVIVLTGFATVENAVRALKDDGAFDFLLKPLDDIAILTASVSRALERRRLRLENHALIRELSKLSTAVTQSPSMVMITDADGIIEYVNPKFTEVTGYPPAEAVGRTPRFLKTERTPPETYATLWRALQAGEIWRGEFVNRKRHGTLFIDRAAIGVVRNREGVTTHFVKVSEDITPRKRAESALKRNERFITAVLDSLATGIAVLGPNGAIVKVNRAWMDAAAENGAVAADEKPGGNYLAVYERDMAAATASGDRRAAKAATEAMSGIRKVLSAESERFEMEYRKDTPAGERWTLLQASRLRDAAFQGVISRADISEFKRLEKRLRLGQKMDAITTLAGGIAHELNNSLAGLVGYFSLLEMASPTSEKTLRYLEGMKSVTTRMTGLAHQLLAYSRGNKYEPRTLTAAGLLALILPDLERIPPADVRIGLVDMDDILLIEVDVAQMRMVFSALARNSSEAMKPGGGSIRITARGHRVTGTARLEPAIPEGSYVRLDFMDDGIGMDEDTLSRVFDPFFSTKFVGRGMGLAAVHGVIHNHGGHVMVSSEPGAGTTFQIFLPVVERETPGSAGAPGGGEMTCGSSISTGY